MPSADLAILRRDGEAGQGAIQPHGMLLSFTEPELTIAQASGNVAEVLGRPVAEIVGRPLSAVLTAGSVLALRGALGGGEERIAPLSVTLRATTGSPVRQALLHRADGLVICELEPEAGALDPTVFVAEVTAAMAAMQGASGLGAVSQRAAEEVKRLTGFDRVMVCRFGSEGDGEVIADAREEWLGSLLGRPAPVIGVPGPGTAPEPLRAIGLIACVDDPPVAIDPPRNPVTGRPLDLGRATLRSAGPVQLRHLRTLGVTAAMTVPLTRDGELWGVIACHHHARLHVDHGTRTACAFLAELLSFQFARVEEADLARERAALRAIRAELLARVRTAGRLGEALRDAAGLMLDLCGADGFAVALDGERVTAGLVPEAALEERLLSALPEDGAPVVIDRLPGERPDVAAGTELCGVLALRLPRGVGRHAAWDRRAWRPEAGEAWSQTVGGRARPWRPAQVQAAAALVGALAEQMVAAMREQLAHAARHDTLTGLPNRALLLERLHHILSRPGRDGAPYVGLLFLDVDNFKHVNDAFGHPAGDLLLREAGRRIGEALRHGDMVGRLGGDEFVVVLQAVEEPAELRRAATRIQQRFATPFELDGSETGVTVSIGIAWAELGHGRSPGDLLRDADTAMYEAKRSGRGRSVEFRAELDAGRRRRTELERHLHGALDRGELLLEYQPVFAPDGTVISLEALVRWDGPQLGRIGPAEFIPIAEEMGLIEQIGAWVLQAAYTQLALLRAAGALDVAMAVNLSARQLADLGLPGELDALLGRLAIPRERAIVEVTESLLVASGGPGVGTLERLRGLGLKVAIDDFGTGFSSLAYLRRLPADVLKIDRAFIAELGHHRADADIVGAVIDLARRLGFRTVAEGVETEPQLRVLRALDCDLVQGFLLARPMPGDAVQGLLRRVPDAAWDEQAPGSADRARGRAG